MLGIENQRARWRANEPGSDPGVFGIFAGRGAVSVEMALLAPGLIVPDIRQRLGRF